MNIIKSLSLKLSLLGNFWQEKFNGRIFRFNLLAILIQFSLLFVQFNDLPPLVPLFYSLPWGEERLAQASSLFLLPIFSIFILLLNNLLSALFLNKIQLFSRLMVVSSLVFSILSFIALLKIISLVS